MSQNSTDFSSYTTGEQPSDWVKIWAEYCTWTVQTAASQSLATAFGAKVLRGDVSGGFPNGLYWQVPGTPTNTDITIRAQAYDVSGSGRIGIAVRMDAGVETGYMLRFVVADNELKLTKRVGGIETVLDTYDTDGACLFLGFNIWYCIRFQVNETALKGKIWRADASEPASWNIEVTDSEISAAGRVGLVFMNDGYCDWFGVGTDGDAPPSFPSVEGLGRFTQTIAEVARTGDFVAHITQSIVEVPREGWRDGRLTQSVVEILREILLPSVPPNFLIFDIDHDLEGDKVKYKCIQLPKLLP